MPCYEVCWEASNSSTCLRYLEDVPVQTDVSSSIRELQRWSDGEQSNLNVSPYGMFTLMLGE
jgi:hypothetical protein